MFLRNHADGIASIDLFVVPTISFRLLYGLLILRHGRRRICPAPAPVRALQSPCNKVIRRLPAVLRDENHTVFALPFAVT
jgi:hypothetical protein